MAKQLIVLSDTALATTVDLLNSTRLQTVPTGGFLTFELNASLATAAARFLLSVQMPSGSTPINAVLVPGTNPAIEGVIDDRTKIMFTLPIGQGGHAVVGLTRVGAGFVTWRITYSGPPILE